METETVTDLVRERCPYCDVAIYGTRDNLDSGMRHHIDYCESRPEEDDQCETATHRTRKTFATISYHQRASVVVRLARIWAPTYQSAWRSRLDTQRLVRAELRLLSYICEDGGGS